MSVGDRVRLTVKARRLWRRDARERVGTVVGLARITKAVRVLWDGKKNSQVISVKYLELWNT